MKTSLTHLPQHKHQELKIIVEITREKYIIEAVILLGSYVRSENYIVWYICRKIKNNR
jgi:hypothetical protein